MFSDDGTAFKVVFILEATVDGMLVAFVEILGRAAGRFVVTLLIGAFVGRRVVRRMVTGGLCVVVLVVVVVSAVVVIVDGDVVVVGAVVVGVVVVGAVVVGAVVAGVATVVGSSSCTDWNVCRRMLSVVVLAVLDVWSGTEEDATVGC